MFLYIVIGLISLFMIYVIQLQIRNIIYIKKSKHKEVIPHEKT